MTLEVVYITNEDGDWNALYFDNKLVVTAHSIGVSHVMLTLQKFIEENNCEITGATYKKYFISNDYFDENCDYPENFTEIPADMIE